MLSFPSMHTLATPGKLICSGEMLQLDARTLRTAIITLLAGTGLHFLYTLLPSLPTALLASVNESIWEHVKILFWPFLIAALFCRRREGKENLSAWLAALLVICGLMLTAGWAAHVRLGVNSLAFDIGLYVALMLLGFWLAGRWQQAAGHPRLWAALTAALLAAILYFTCSPPDAPLFADPALADAWYQLPC